jgi:hypothetical protein
VFQYKIVLFANRKIVLGAFAILEERPRLKRLSAIIGGKTVSCLARSGTRSTRITLPTFEGYGPDGKQMADGCLSSFVRA